MWYKDLWTSLVCFSGSAEPNEHIVAAQPGDQHQRNMDSSQVSDLIYLSFEKCYWTQYS